jgi:1-pyrroline-5-carboxylate dehydrogenase
MKPRQTQFTGSSHIADKLTRLVDGKIRIEDAGFDWKVLGPDVPKNEADIDYIAW